MKRFFLLLITILNLPFLFAQNQKYTDLLAQAENYEKLGKYFYALATYYDAIQEEPTVACIEAYKKFVEIGEYIYNGVPGTPLIEKGKFRKAEVNFIAEFDQYWNEHSRVEVHFGAIKEDGINYEERSKIYKVPVYIHFSEKYRCLNSIFNSGFKKEKSNIKRSYNEITFTITNKENSVLAHMKQTIHNYEDSESIEGDRFSSASPELVEAIEQNNIRFEVTKLVQDYKGSYQIEDSHYEYTNVKSHSDYEPWQKDFSIGAIENIIENDINSKAFAKRKASIKNDFPKLYKLIKIDDLKLEVGTTEVTQKLFIKVMNYNPSLFYLKDNYPVDNVTLKEAVIFCNRLSIAMGYKPCYSVKKNLNPDKWESLLEEKDSSDIETEFCSLITCNFKSNGFRLPTEKEWKTIAEKGNEPVIFKSIEETDNHVWFKNNSNKTTHPVGTKTANSLGIYDMFGNVCERIWDKSEYGYINDSSLGCDYDTELYINYRTKEGYEYPLYKSIFESGIRLVRTISE